MILGLLNSQHIGMEGMMRAVTACVLGLSDGKKSLSASQSVGTSMNSGKFLKLLLEIYTYSKGG